MTVRTLLFASTACALAFSAHPCDARDREAKSCGGRIDKTDGSPKLTVAAGEASCAWPFTAQTVTIACDSSKGTTAITATTDDGVRYAISEEASDLASVRPIEEILNDDPNGTDGKADYDTWSDVGLALCR